MDIAVWFAFVAASAVVLAIPGPTILMVVGRALGGGRAQALPIVAGVAAGDLTAMTLSLLGLGALLATSAALFTVFKVIGAAYLVWLGVGLWRAPVAAADAPLSTVAPWRAARDTFVVTALNPKSIAFFIAFVPQFVAPARPFAPQAAILIATFVTMAAANAAIYAMAAGRLATRIRRPSVRRWFNRAGGTMLIGAGAATALMKRA